MPRRIPRLTQSRLLDAFRRLPLDRQRAYGEVIIASAKRCETHPHETAAEWAAWVVGQLHTQGIPPWLIEEVYGPMLGVAAVRRLLGTDPETIQ